MLNKRTMNNNSHRQHDQLENCSSYSEHVDSIFPTPIDAVMCRNRGLPNSMN